MELADRTLLDRFREAVGQGFPGIPAPEIFEHFLDAARALDFLNEPRHPAGGSGPQGIQHRDVKPQNLLLVGGSVKVADFGLARVLEHTSTGHTGSMTPSYAAPEFFDHKTSSQSDQYSLAVTYCHLRGGRLPFEGNPAAVMAGHVMREPDLSMIPENERPAVARAMAKSPRDRWPSCRAFVQAVTDSAKGKHTSRNARKMDAPPTTAPFEAGGAPPTTIPGDGTELELKSSRPRVRKRSVYKVGIWGLVAVGLLASTTFYFRGQRPLDLPTDSRMLSPPRPSSKVPFQPLFNGKDKSGWKTFPTQPGDWFVEDGKLVGRNGPSYLFTERGDFEDFHLRVEAKLNAEGNSGVYFRSEYGLSHAIAGGRGQAPEGYEAQMFEGKGIPGTNRTGSLMTLVVVDAQLVPPDTWFVLEVFAEGNHIRLKINGEETASYVDAQRRYTRGHIALQCYDKATRVEFRKIEIHETPPGQSSSAASAPTPPAVSPDQASKILAFIDQGLKLIANGDNKQAIVEFDSALGLDPGRPMALAGKGFALVESGDRVQSLSLCEQAIRLDPQVDLAYAGRGLARSHNTNADFKQARMDCDEAIRLNPRRSAAFAARCKLYADHGWSTKNQGDLNLALADGEMAVRLNKQSALAHYARGIARRHLGQNDLAEADFNEAIHLNPHIGKAFEARATVWNNRGNKAKADLDHKEAARLIGLHGR